MLQIIIETEKYVRIIPESEAIQLVTPSFVGKTQVGGCILTASSVYGDCEIPLADIKKVVVHTDDWRKEAIRNYFSAHKKDVEVFIAD